MGADIQHATSSVKRWGGCVEDYLPIHRWFDETKRSSPDFRHRILRHHAEGMAECIAVFGDKIYLHHQDGTSVRKTNGEQMWIPTRHVTEQHLMEDHGRIPVLADWLRAIQSEPWMKGIR